MIREAIELLSYHHRFAKRQALHDYNNVFQKALRDLGQVGLTKLAEKHVLDLGCGQRFPFALLCAANRAEATALDLNYVKPDALPLAFFRVWRHNGPKRALKTVVRRALFDGRYYEVLEGAAQQALRRHVPRVSFVVADPQSAIYPLPDQRFDLIASNAVVEHVKDVSSFAAEVRRLLRGGAISTPPFTISTPSRVVTRLNGHIQMKGRKQKYHLGITCGRIGTHLTSTSIV